MLTAMHSYETPGKNESGVVPIIYADIFMFLAAWSHPQGGRLHVLEMLLYYFCFISPDHVAAVCERIERAKERYI